MNFSVLLLAASLVYICTASHIVPLYYFTPFFFQVGYNQTTTLVLDTPPTNSFTVEITASNALIFPNTITFTNSGPLEHTFSILSETNGYDALNYTITGPDASLVDNLDPVYFRVSQYFDPPYLEVHGEATVGIPLLCKLVIPDTTPPLTSLIVTLEAEEFSPAIISPSTFILGPNDTPNTTYDVFVTPINSYETISILAYLSGVDSIMFPSPVNSVVHVNIGCPTSCNASGICTLTPPPCALCLPDVYGTDCSAYCDPVTTCGGKGYCNSTGQCVCTPNYSGPLCNTCEANLYGPSCDIYCNANLSCNGNGECSEDTGACDCFEGFLGSSCNVSSIPTNPPTTIPTSPPTSLPTSPPTTIPTSPPTSLPTNPPTVPPIIGTTTCRNVTNPVTGKIWQLPKILGYFTSASNRYDLNFCGLSQYPLCNTPNFLGEPNIACQNVVYGLGTANRVNITFSGDNNKLSVFTMNGAGSGGCATTRSSQFIITCKTDASTNIPVDVTVSSDNCAFYFDIDIPKTYCN